MDERTLNDLLECSVCLERLDTSSKVLPCQHTFCKKCLEEIVATKQELRCPECRVLVTSSIEELPPNVLLMRILGGIMRTGNTQLKKRAPLPTQRVLPTAAASPLQPSTTLDAQIVRPFAPVKQPSPLGPPMARAIYDYQSSEPGDLVFRKGDVITLRNKVDVHWCQGEYNGRTGVFPLSYVQVITPLPPQVATARALYDFKMNNDEEEGCLSFRKDEILAVLRRVDENWVEGRLGGRVGIFPLAFVELNPVARALMKLSANEQPGPSRVAPPTPIFDESTPLISTDTGTINNAGSHTAAENNLLNVGQTTPASSVSMSTGVRPTVVGAASDSSTSTSTTTPNSSSNSTSSSSTAPSSPASPPPPPPQQQQQTPPPQSSQSNPFLRPQTILLPTSHITTQARDKRHSFSALTASQPAPPTNRHSAEILSGDGESVSESSVGASANSCNSSAQTTMPAREQNTPLLVRSGSQRHRRSGSDFAVVQLPAAYVALYPYKPQKADELELKKGGVYLVTERCQDGWFKGTSNRTQKCGVFPGNYVTLAKPLQNSQSRVVSSSPRDTSIAPATALKSKPNGGSPAVLRSPAICALAPPELPPRSASPAPRVLRHPWGSPVIQSKDEGGASVELHASPPSQAQTKVEQTPRRVSNAVSPPPNVSVSLSPVPNKSSEKVKEKKEKPGLIKRIAAMKRSKSPSAPTYSMDNPVFDDSPVVMTGFTSPHPVHARSGSCPNQLIEMHHQRVMSASSSARVRHKERPSVAAAHFALSSSRLVDGVNVPGTHRKSSSLDGSDPRNPKQLVPPVRERFRCIVPYPPNSEYELELRVGDIIYVHRKRDDGWYKGTQQRTGRTGLFPASFVETY